MDAAAQITGTVFMVYHEKTAGADHMGHGSPQGWTPAPSGVEDNVLHPGGGAACHTSMCVTDTRCAAPVCDRDSV